VPAGGSEKILLVEDNDLVREQAIIRLERLGYRVVFAADGVEAIELLKATPDIQLLFTDIVMPHGINGFELAAEARKLMPDLPILFTSGYSEKVLNQCNQFSPGVSWLNKPYLADEFAEKIRFALDSARVQK
jgi:CheY-like chemotaxis protein